MLIICKKYPLAGLLASEGTKDVTQGLNYLVAEEGSSLDDIYDLAITTDGKIFFACQPDDGKDVCNAIQAVVDTWLIFEKKDGGA